MSMQIYRIAVSVCEAFIRFFFESDAEAEDDRLVYADQVATYRGLVQREVARVEARKCTMEILCDRTHRRCPRHGTAYSAGR